MSGPSDLQPAGGFGAPGAGGSFPQGQPPRPKGTNWGLVIVAGAGVFVALGGILAVLGVYGVRKYISSAKAAESTVTVGYIGKRAAETYEEREGTYCPSATSPVPAAASAIRGMKYQSSADDWTRDQKANAGFACLKFELSQPQYYQYDYRSTGHTFEAIARGDLDGDGKLSLFRMRGTEAGGKPVLAPSLEQEDPEE